MAKYTNLKDLFTSIANAIRAKTGSTDTIVADNFPTAIEAIEVGGSSEEDYNKGYEAGRQAEHAAIINPNWTNWSFFAHPSSPRPIDVNCLHYSDTANGTNFSDFSSNNGNITKMQPIDTSNGQNFSRMFYFCRALHTIGELNLSKATDLAGMLSWCDALVHIHFVPSSIRISLGLEKSNKLDDASIQDIIAGLADMTGQTAQKITFHTDVLLKLTEEQINAIGAKNWTF